MPLPEPYFSELILRLEGESGMRRKVRVLADSWSELRQLSPAQRERLALVIGNRWAWRHIEGYFGNKEVLSDNQREVQKFFDDMRETEPEKLQEVSSEIRQNGFRAAAKHVLGAAEEVLGDDETRLEEEPPEVAPLVVVDPVAAVAAKSPPKQVEREPEPKPVPVRASSAVEPKSAEDRVFESRRSDAKALSAVESLRVLRQLSAGKVPSTRPARAAMVRSLSSGWAARRAVSALICSHSPTDLDEALALIRELPTAAQQIWCLGDLVEHWDLDDSELPRVLATAPTRAAENRLVRRTERAV